MADEVTYVEFGQFGSAHGVHGEIRLFADDLDREWFRSGSELHVETFDGMRSLTLETCRETPDFGIAAFEELDDRTDAEKLRNCSVYIDRDALPEPDDGEFYQFQLRGADVYLSLADPAANDARRIGSVGGFFDANGANDVMVVWLGDDEDDELFVPMTEGAIQELDPNRPRVTLEPSEQWAPEGTNLEDV